MCTFTKLHDRRIPNVGVRVRVGVGPVEFQLNAWRDQAKAMATKSEKLTRCKIATLPDDGRATDDCIVHKNLVKVRRMVSEIYW